MGVLQKIDSGAEGIIPNTLEYLFNYLKNQRTLSSYAVHLSFYQIYLEQVSDLLNPDNKNMIIREEQGDIFIHDLVEVHV